MNKPRYGIPKAKIAHIKFELSQARLMMEGVHRQSGPSKEYFRWQGVVDGMVTILSILGVSTKP